MNILDTGVGSDVLFPLPGIDLPYKPMTHSRCVTQRYKRSLSVTTLANNCIHALNSLSTSSYVSSMDTHSPNDAASITSAQSRIIAHIYSSANRFSHHTRMLSGCHSDSTTMDPSHFIHSKATHGPSVGYFTSGAIPLVASKVALPSVAGQVNMLDRLPPHIADVYRSPTRCIRSLPLAKPSHPIPKARVFASHTEYIRLLLRMLPIHMVSFTTTPIVINGLFGVPKDDGNIRLIVDGRPANVVFDDSPHVELPTPDLIAKLTVANPNTKLFVAKSDLSDFFYRFSIPIWMRPYFALPPVLAEEVGMDSVYGIGTRIYPCLTVLAMGWSHSVYVAQSIHEHLLNTNCPSLPPANRITRTSDLVIDRLRHAVYVDDLIMVGTDQHEQSRALTHYLDVTTTCGLPAKPSKVVWPCATGVDCLGMHLHGTGLTVGVRPDKLHRLCMMTQQVMMADECTGIEMASIVGSWAWAMLVARPALSIFSSVYRFIQCAGSRPFRVWPSVVRELTNAIHVAPLLYAHIGTPTSWFDRVIAVDASLDGLGVCATRDVHVHDVMAASSHSGVIHIDSRDDVVESLLDRPLLTARWSTIVAAPWRITDSHEHINSLEMRSVSTAIRWVLSSPISIRSRLLLLSDSQVVVGALSKGRTSSFSLLCRVRPVCAFLLASGIQLYARWVASADNPADAPSRAFSPTW